MIYLGEGYTKINNLSIKWSFEKSKLLNTIDLSEDTVEFVSEI